MTARMTSSGYKSLNIIFYEIYLYYILFALRYFITYMHTIGFDVPTDVVIVTNHFYINYYYTRAVFGATPTDVATIISLLLYRTQKGRLCNISPIPFYIASGAATKYDHISTIYTRHIIL